MAGLVVLATLDVVLVAAALNHVKQPSNASEQAQAGLPPTSAESLSSTPSDRASGSAPVRAVPSGPLLLSQASDGTLLRATFGGCTDDSDPEVAVSNDQGRTFRAVSVARELKGVLAVEANARSDLRVVGADATCTARSYSGTSRTRAWQAGASETAWHLMLNGVETVHSPEGVVETPCTPVMLSTVGAVRLLCEDGAVLGTSDAGKTWAALGRLLNASAFAFDGPSRGYAIVTRSACPAAVITSYDGGASWTFSACLDGKVGRAIAARGEVVTALVDDDVFRSEDGAATWEQLS